MRTRIERRVAARYRWDRLKVSFWFTPLVMALGAVLLAWVMYWIDGLIPNEVLEESRFVLAGTPNEMRSSLLNIAGTVLATAGVVFTLLTLPLSTVAAQYGSRLLRLFLGDRTAQFVLGMFVATFVYCIFAALSIPPTEVELESPQLTATVAVYLMLVTFATLILLVQHISTMLQAPNIAAAAGAELLAVARAEISEDTTHSAADQGLLETPAGATGAPEALAEKEGYPVPVTEAGYIQYMDPEMLLALAREKNLVIHLLHRPGHFVGIGAVVALVWPVGQVDPKVAARVRSACQLGNVRTPTQDVEYAVNQLTEMAVRAMSPAINDPFTAMTCLDHMGVGLVEFIRRGEQGSHCYDRDGRLRLILQPVTFAALLGAAFDMLRHASCDNASVLLHMLHVIESIGQAAQAPAARQELLRHVNLIQAESEVGDLIQQDRQSIQVSGQALRVKLADTT
ncbi:MAG TPA: DUF2254 domain-containing protein [Anaerolineae bacterium]|nr:DUF2254 domain-containing protein [Anaerolineae bacterium]